MRRYLMWALALTMLAAAPIEAQDRLSDRQLRQRLTYAIARAENQIDEGREGLGHLVLMFDEVHARIVADSLAGVDDPEPDPEPDPTPDPEPDPHPDPDPDPEPDPHPDPEPDPDPEPTPDPDPEPDPGPEPTGDLVFDGFESARLSTDTNGFRWASTNRTSVVRSDGCVVFNGAVINTCGLEDRQWESRPGSGGSHALRFRYASGQPMTEQRYSIGSAHPELWASWWLRVPINFRHLDGPSSDNNKLFMFWMDDYSTRGDGSTVGMETRPDGSGGARWYVKVSPGRGSVLGGDQGSTPFISYPSDQGRWMKIVVRIKAETSAGAGDGLMQVWRRWEDEGSFTQTHNRTGQPIRLPSGGPNGFTAGYLMGYANSAYGPDTEFLIDDFTLSTTSLLNQ
jgi:hypothetical protein